MLTEETMEQLKPIMEADGVPEIKGSYRKAVTAKLIHNQLTESASSQQITAQFLNESTNVSGGLGAGTNIASFDPVMISLVRRVMPNLVAYDIASVQPMNGPTSLIFAMRARYQTGSDSDLTDDPEALFNEANTRFSGVDSVGNLNGNTASDVATDPTVMMETPAGSYTTGKGMSTTQLESLGAGGTKFQEMGFTIDKVTVTANGRALKSSYTVELAQDLKKIHGLDAETELSNILQSELLFEINREVIRTVYVTAKIGCQQNTTAAAGIYDLDIDSNGRWSVERFKGMLFQIEREANQIAKETRRGKGNIILCSSDVASALALSGKLDYAPALSTDLEVNDMGQTFAGVLNGRFKVFIDPYFATTSGNHLIVVGFRGTSPYDAGLFYCPYVPLEMARVVDPETFQPAIGFKTRYGMTANPFAQGTTVGGGALTLNTNVYYRKFMVKNLG